MITVVATDVAMTWWRRVEAPVNFEKKSERLTLHGVTGFIPRVLPVLHALHVLQALPVLPVLLK